MATTQANVINDLGVLLKLPAKVTSELISKADLCIGSIINDAKAANERIVVINIGIGTLSVNLDDMQCKFVPSKDLKMVIRESLNSGLDPLELSLEKTLTDKLLEICEEVA